MVDISFVLVLALVSSTVVAQPGTKVLTSLFSCFRLWPTPTPPKLFTESVHEWIPLNGKTSTPTSDEDPADIGLSYILQQLNIQPGQFTRRTSFTDRFGVTHLYGMPLHKGLFIGDLHAAVHIKNGRVFFYSAIIKNNHALTKRSPTTPESMIKKSSEEAVRVAVDHFKIPFYNGIVPVMESYWTGNIHIPVWVFQLRDEPITQWFEVRVNANTGDIVSMEDFNRGFTYTAIKLPNENPKDGFSTILNPENFQASPNGWTEGFELEGNNALVRIEGGMEFEATIKGIFDRPFDPTLPPQAFKNLVAGAINAFYVANTVHDTLYQYGFTEKAGNFQMDNFNKGGKEGDPIIINVQSSKETNNAYFLTPLDGQSGVLNLHIFTATKPNRDSALDNTILTHELTHGLSERLTGGARTKGCMTETESLGLSEGYSDMMALIFMAKPEDTHKGRYNLGAIWAVMLLEVYWNLVEKYGFSANLHDATQEKAHDAMLAADDAYYGGINKHLIREGFAKRGLGSIS
ncbi:hypothetical protein BSLG_010814 [Batrachochytrium salamandrivorans]|nr:hypothetical protein BSLG_010814 [Batrachochytrium salamandrivorans]